jgi:hypothetical protein
MPKRKSSLGVPVKVYNLGSPAGTLMDFDRDELWNRMDTEMGIEAVSIPVFLVNEEQMDYLYPPEFCRALDPECVRRELASSVERHREEEEENSFFERLKRCEEEGWAKYKKVVAVGLYLNLERHNRYDASFKKSVLSLGDSSFLTPQAENAFLQQSKPAIFLCCERIIDRANRVGVSHHLVMDKVYYHELGHAIMDTLPIGAPNPYHEIWGRIVEESLANAIAYRCFSGKEARWVERLIQTQPAEYLGYAAVNQVLVTRPDFRHYWDWIRRHPEELLWFCWRNLFDWWEFWFNDILLPEYQISSLLLKGRLDSINISIWKQFKKTIKSSDAYKLQIWKNFAIYLLQAGLD